MWDALAKDAFDWTMFYEHHKVESSAELSEDFRQEMQPLLLAPDLSEVALATRLEQVVDAVRQAFLQAGPLSSAMEVVYRARRSTGEGSLQGRKSQRVRVPAVDSQEEDQDLQSAIALSLQADGTKAEEHPSSSSSSSELSDVYESSRSDASNKRSSKRLRTTVEASQTQASAARDLPSTDAATSKDVIGVERFNFFQAELDAWLKRMGSYWRSEREPQGVAARDVAFKCRSCEVCCGPNQNFSAWLLLLARALMVSAS